MKYLQQEDWENGNNFFLFRFAAQSIAQILRMTSCQKGLFLKKYFTAEQIRQLLVR